MPRLGQERLVEYVIPLLEHETPDDQVIVMMDMRFTGEQVMRQQSSADNEKTTFDLLASTIKRWNFTDAEGKEEPINEETVRRLEAHHVIYLSDKISERIESLLTVRAVPTDEKKG